MQILPPAPQPPFSLREAAGDTSGARPSPGAVPRSAPQPSRQTDVRAPANGHQRPSPRRAHVREVTPGLRAPPHPHVTSSRLERRAAPSTSAVARGGNGRRGRASPGLLQQRCLRLTPARGNGFSPRPLHAGPERRLPGGAHAQRPSPQLTCSSGGRRGHGRAAQLRWAPAGSVRAPPAPAAPACARPRPQVRPRGGAARGARGLRRPRVRGAGGGGPGSALRRSGSPAGDIPVPNGSAWFVF